MAVKPVISLIQLNNPYRSKKLELCNERGRVGQVGGAGRIERTVTVETRYTIHVLNKGL